MTWTVACQALLSVRFSRQEYCSELPFPSPGDLPNPGIKPGSPALQEDSLQTELSGKPDGNKDKTVSIVLPFSECHIVKKKFLSVP